MRILHVIPSVSLVHGGPSRAIRLMEQAQRAAGLDVFTLTTDDDGPGRRLPPAAREPGRHYARKWLDFYKIAPGLLFWLLRHVRRHDVVHIHALFSFSSVMAAWAARWRGVPYVIRPLGTLAGYGISRRRPLLKRLSLRFVEGPILRHAAAVHFTSESEWQEAEALLPGLPGIVVPLGIADMPLAVAPAAPREMTLLYLSRLDPKKNVETLLAALALLRGDGLVLPLLLAGAGRGDYVARLQRDAEARGLSGQIAWLGEVDGDIKAALWQQADVFVLPSFSENFGIAAAEALMAGLPCILAEGVAIAGDAAAAGAALSITPDAQALAEALRKLHAEPGLRRDMAGRARALGLREYSAATMVSRLSELYLRIVPAGRHAS